VTEEEQEEVFADLALGQLGLTRRATAAVSDGLPLGEALSALGISGSVWRKRVDELRAFDEARLVSIRTDPPSKAGASAR
jgi:hypothetical protein